MPKLDASVDWRRQGKDSGGARRGGPGRLLAFALVALALSAASAGGVSALAAGSSKPRAHSSGPAAQTLKKTMWGPTTLPNGASAFPTFRDLGVGIYALQVRWDQVAPTTRPLAPTDPLDPAYQWPDYVINAVSEAQSYGMQVQIMIIGTPPWANGGRSWEWKPDNPSDFADFATAIATRFPAVHLWMIWGEPNRKPNFKPFTPVRGKNFTGKLNKAEQVAPRNYAQLLDAAYGALKAVSPQNRVIGGNTYTSAGRDDINPYQWARYLKLPNGSKPRMDMWGHNPYGFAVPNLKDPPSRRGTVAFADLKRLTKVLDKAFRGKRLKLYLSEWGVPIGFKDKDLLYRLKPKEGKKWIKAGFRIARKFKRIYTLGWVHLLDDARSSQGLMDINGKRKPGYKTYKAG